MLFKSVSSYREFGTWTDKLREKEQFLLLELLAPKSKKFNLNSTVRLLPAVRAKGFELNSTNDDELAKYSRI